MMMVNYLPLDLFLSMWCSHNWLNGVRFHVCGHFGLGMTVYCRNLSVFSWSFL